MTAAYDAGATVDVELSSGLLSGAENFPDRSRVVVSRHCPFSLPEDWEGILAAMRAAGARTVKLVAGAADLPASLAIAAIQKRQERSAVSVFPMGPASAPGRVLSAFFGASLVYGSVERRTAPGQLAAGRPPRDLRNRPAPFDRGSLRHRRSGCFGFTLSSSSQCALSFARAAFSLPAIASRGLRPLEAAGARLRSPLSRLLRDPALEAAGRRDVPPVRGCARDRRRQHARSLPRRVASGEYRRGRGLRSARRSRHGRRPQRRDSGRGRRGARGGRRGEEAWIRGHGGEPP